MVKTERMANAIFRQLLSMGFESKEIQSIAKELIGMCKDLEA